MVSSAEGEGLFVHLRVHSAYSLSEGAIPLKHLVRRCREMGMPAVAVTDTGNLFGALEFAVAAAEAGIQPIIGTLLHVGRREEPTDRRQPQSPDQILLLAKDDQGYANLSQLTSRAFLDTSPGIAPQVDFDLLARHSDGLIALTGGPFGAVGRLLGEGQAEAAGAALDELAALFSDRLYVELTRHGPDYLDGLPERIEPALVDLALSKGLPLVATNDCYFAEADTFEAHDALLCIADGAYVADQDRRRVTPEHRLKSAAEMAALFEDIPEAVSNTVVVARRCAAMPERRQPIFPKYDPGPGRTAEDDLRDQAGEGLNVRLEAVARRAAAPIDRDPYVSRLEFELNVIIGMGFAGYFLIVADFIKWAKSQSIPVGPGRGSGAGSAVAWALTITDLDPLEHGLLFERFLNPDRVSMPDFDIDFCQDRRDEVIRYVQNKYGEDHVAQIITFGKFQARAVLRDVGRVLQLPYGQVDRICKLVPNNPANPVSLAQALEMQPDLRREREEDPLVAEMISHALKLEGLYRHASTHAAGVVIGDRPLAELVPLYRDPRSTMPVTQFNMKWVEQAGLVKFDFLGLKTLTVLERSLELIGTHADPPDLETLPLDDKPAYALMSSGATVGVFQMEGTGMRDVLKQMQPDRFQDVVALVALYRPGPMDNIPTYIAAKSGKQKPDYLYPTLEPILTETYGIMVYQEQVMRVAQELAGYSLGAADLLRRAMGKKIRAEMEAQKKSFVDGAVAREVPRGQAASIFDQVEKFAGYGFNKSHAAAYAVIAYQTAYLKANFPVEFLAASMTYDMGNTDKLAIFKQELVAMGITLLGPDINRSQTTFSVEQQESGKLAVRYALGAIKGVGAEAMDALVRERDAGGPYRDLTDLAGRLEPSAINRRQIENLAKAGGFDSLNDNRRQCFDAAAAMQRLAAAATDDRRSGQVSMFAGEGPPVESLRLQQSPDWAPLERLNEEHGAIGFYLTSHPLEIYPVKRVAAPSNEILGRLSGGQSQINLAGIVTTRRETFNRSGKRMCFLSLSDPAGSFEVTLFEEVLATSRPLLEPNRALLLGVTVQERDGNPRLTATSVEPLDEAIKRAGMSIAVIVGDEAAIGHVKAVLDRGGRGRGRVALRVRLAVDLEAELDLGGRFAVTPESRAAIKGLPGVIDVAHV